MPLYHVFNFPIKRTATALGLIRDIDFHVHSARKQMILVVICVQTTQLRTPLEIDISLHINHMLRQHFLFLPRLI